jgi:integrase
LAVYTGLRKGSLRALRWESVDFKHGTLTSLESKTNLAQIFALVDPALPGMRTLIAALQCWYELSGQPSGATHILTETGAPRGREAATLRADLLAAGIKRDVLFADERNIEPLRFHDMRATFVTWARRAGKGRGWITDRTGHLSDDMMRRYDRGARVLADLNYAPFPDLVAMLPELTRVGASEA